jgi:ribonuclease HII
LKSDLHLLIAGVDDAGRGAVIGPLVIAGVAMKEENLHKLVEIGAKDSKLLTPHRREVLSSQIKEIAYNYHIIELSPREIDTVVFNGWKLHKLNRLEAHTMARVIETLNPDKAIVDASDVLENRFREHIVERLTHKIEVISEHKADRNYPVVGAASILAKVTRDHEIERLKETLEDFGSGYPSDPRTMKFLRACAQKWTEYPDFVRKSWEPAQKTRAESDQRQRKLT